MDNNLKFSDDGDKLPRLICIITGKGELKESKPEVFISPILMLLSGGGGGLREVLDCELKLNLPFRDFIYTIARCFANSRSWPYTTVYKRDLPDGWVSVASRGF